MSTFRKTYRKLNAEEQELIEQIKDAAERLENLFGDYKFRGGRNVREMSLAQTNLEQSVMWAVKAVTG